MTNQEAIQADRKRLASLGGKARAASLTKERRAQIAKRAAKARWQNGKRK